MENNNNQTEQPQSEQSENKPKRQPTTIGELKLWYVYHHLPPEEVTRFFIGKDYQGPKAFGIYKDEQGDCVVYKNKANGERAVRYKGPDEAFAVGELLERLKAEIARQKARRGAVQSNLSDSDKKRSDDNADSDPTAGIREKIGDVVSDVASTISSKRKGCFLTMLIGFVVALFVGLGNSVPNGYYKYSGKHYYHQGSSWYYYNPTDRHWSPTESLDNIITHDNADEYRINGFTGEQFENSKWYDDGNNWYDDDDDDDSYWDDDDDSWDSNDTDWDDDW